jgi:hypothetical protein
VVGLKQLSAREKSYLQEINITSDLLRSNQTRRLRNALFALANMDKKGWLFWVEKNVPPHCATGNAIRIVEVRARTLLMQYYKHLGSDVAQTIIDGNRPFADDGSLSL